MEKRAAGQTQEAVQIGNLQNGVLTRMKELQDLMQQSKTSSDKLMQKVTELSSFVTNQLKAMTTSITAPRENLSTGTPTGANSPVPALTMPTSADDSDTKKASKVPVPWRKNLDYGERKISCRDGKK